MTFLENMKLYLQHFWSRFNLMTYENAPLFHNSMQGFSFLILLEKEYWKENLMVVEPDELYESHFWTWKAKITRFFIHEFYGNEKVFFQVEY